MAENGEQLKTLPIEGERGVPVQIFPPDRPIFYAREDAGLVSIEQRINVPGLGILVINFNNGNVQQPSFINDGIANGDRVLLLTDSGPIVFSERDNSTGAERIKAAQAMEISGIVLEPNPQTDKTALPDLRLSAPRAEILFPGKEAEDNNPEGVLGYRHYLDVDGKAIDYLLVSTKPATVAQLYLEVD